MAIARAQLVDTSLTPRTNRPLHNVGILVLAEVDMGQHQPPRFDWVFHHSKRPSRVRPGYLEHHAHTAERN
jgi:hypothetical protein